MVNLKAKKIKLFMAIFILATVGAVGASFFGHRIYDTPSEVIVSALQDRQANMMIENVNHEATKNGIKQWRLNAKSAQLFDTQNKLVLDDLAVVFFLENKRKIYLRARQGVLKTDTNDIQVEGNVDITSDTYHVVTESLHYAHNRRIMTSPVPVQVTGDLFQISSNRMTIALEEETAQFNGKVKAVLQGAQLF